MKFKIELVEKNLYRNAGIEFDDEGFLIIQPLRLPMKKRKQHVDYLTIEDSQIKSGRAFEEYSRYH